MGMDPNDLRPADDNSTDDVEKTDEMAPAAGGEHDAAEGGMPQEAAPAEGAAEGAADDAGAAGDGDDAAAVADDADDDETERPAQV